MYFAPKLTGSYWNWVLALGVRKTKMMALLGRKNMFDDIFSHLDTICERGGQTDRHRPIAKTALMHSDAR